MKLFYFAWIDEAEAFDPDVHNRIDENVFSHKISQEEGNFATLDIEVKNPRIGLLNAGRPRWAYYAFDDGSTITPLFKGRLIGIPDNIFETVVTFQFIAKPSDWVARKNALADTLRVRPYWDDLLIAPESWGDPDTVLEARSALWHIDPVTHEVTISDVLVPEDGVLEFQVGEFFRDGMGLQLQQVPLRAVTVEATFPWENARSGAFDLLPSLLNAFPDKPADFSNYIWSYTFEGLSSDWPKAGAKIGDWVVASGDLTDNSFIAVKEMNIPVWFDTTQIERPLVEGAILFQPKISGKIWGGVDGAGYDTQAEIVVVNPGYGRPNLTVEFSASRDYAQTLRFTMEANIQAILTETTEDEATVISLTANKLTDVGFNEEIALGFDARTFLDTPRGLEAVEHCLLIARSYLCIRGRAVHITFQAPFSRGLAVSLRKGALIHDPRLPGGEAAGKIISWSHESGTNSNVTTVVMGCSIGYGGSHTEDAGVGVYAEAGYIAPGYQQMKNVVKLIPTADITYEMPETATFDDGLDISRMNTRNIIKQISVLNGPGSQASAILATKLEGGVGDQQAVQALLQTIPTQITLELVPLNTGPHLGGVQPAVSVLELPKQIDLEAAST